MSIVDVCDQVNYLFMRVLDQTDQWNKRQVSLIRRWLFRLVFDQFSATATSARKFATMVFNWIEFGLWGLAGALSGDAWQLRQGTKNSTIIFFLTVIAIVKTV